jgi:hypothetical protein
MLEFLKIAAVVILSSVAGSAVLAHLLVVFARRSAPPAHPVNDSPESGSKAIAA